MSLNASWLDNGLTAMYWRKYRAIFSSSLEGTVLIWWMYSDSRINSSHSWWPSLQGGNTPTHGITQKKKKKRKSKIRPYLQKRGGYWVQNSQARRVRVFDPSRESVFSQETMSGWKQMLLLLRGALVSPRRMLWFHTVPLLHCTAGNVWSVIFSTCHKIPMHSQTSKTTLALPGLSRCLPAPNPPSTPTPSNSNPAAKGTPPKFWKKASDGGCFCVVHSLILPLFMCLLLVNHSAFK